MAKKVHKNKTKKKKLDKLMRLKVLLGVDLCACGPLYRLKCQGKCRKIHTTENGDIKCSELYRIDPSIFRINKKKGRQKKDNDGEYLKNKNRRRDKFEACKTQ